MKYYKNLIKRKKFGKLMASLMFALVGILVIYIGFADLAKNGVQFTDIPYGASGDSILVFVLSRTNWGVILCGLIIVYMGLVYLPHNIPEAQEDSDYTVESRNDKIYIKFRNNEFLIDKEKFSPTDFFFHDKNHKFVSVTRGYQIYNYVMAKYRHLTEKQVDKDKVIEAKEIENKFYPVKTMSDEDKLKYLQYKKIKKSYRPFSFIIALLFFGATGFWALGLIAFLAEDLIDIKNIITSIMMLLVCFWIGTKILKHSAKNKKLYEKIMNHKMYVVDCYSYDKKMDIANDETTYYIKVANNEYYLNQWFEIPKEKYVASDIVRGKLIFFEESTLGEIDLIV